MASRPEGGVGEWASREEDAVGEEPRFIMTAMPDWSVDTGPPLAARLAPCKKKREKSKIAHGLAGGPGSRRGPAAGAGDLGLCSANHRQHMEAVLPIWERTLAKAPLNLQGGTRCPLTHPPPGGRWNVAAVAVVSRGLLPETSY